MAEKYIFAESLAAAAEFDETGSTFLDKVSIDKNRSTTVTPARGKIEIGDAVFPVNGLALGDLKSTGPCAGALWAVDAQSTLGDLGRKFLTLGSGTAPRKETNLVGGQ